MELRTRTTATMHLHGARQIQSVPRKVDQCPTYPKGRVCSEPGCDTILNQYHRGPECFACWISSLPAEERLAA
jgi:hypothetical protein